MIAGVYSLRYGYCSDATTTSTLLYGALPIEQTPGLLQKFKPWKADTCWQCNFPVWAWNRQHM